MDDPIAPFVVILVRGEPLSPAEDLETAIIAAAHAQASGLPVTHIEQGTEVVLAGPSLQEAMAAHSQWKTWTAAVSSPPAADVPPITAEPLRSRYRRTSRFLLPM
jgi:hypothetical protein